MIRTLQYMRRRTLNCSFSMMMIWSMEKGPKLVKDSATIRKLLELVRCREMCLVRRSRWRCSGRVALEI